VVVWWKSKLTFYTFLREEKGFFLMISAQSLALLKHGRQAVSDIMLPSQMVSLEAKQLLTSLPDCQATAVEHETSLVSPLSFMPKSATGDFDASTNRVDQAGARYNTKPSNYI
jgi:hypothetical protein